MLHGKSLFRENVNKQMPNTTTTFFRELFFSLFFLYIFNRSVVTREYILVRMQYANFNSLFT